MKPEEQISAYIATQPESKRADLQALHQMIREIMPGSKLWFLDGRNSEGQVVSNPNIGYGLHTIRYANGTSREFYRVGLSANTAGISVYIMGIGDKNYLRQAYGQNIGKATVSGYCIRFKKLTDINPDVLEAAIRDGIRQNG